MYYIPLDNALDKNSYNANLAYSVNDFSGILNFVTLNLKKRGNRNV
jgi:hypothetical protein